MELETHVDEYAEDEYEEDGFDSDQPLEESADATREKDKVDASIDKEKSFEYSMDEEWDESTDKSTRVKSKEAALVSSSVSPLVKTKDDECRTVEETSLQISAKEKQEIAAGADKPSTTNDIGLETTLRTSDENRQAVQTKKAKNKPLVSSSVDNISAITDMEVKTDLAAADDVDFELGLTPRTPVVDNSCVDIHEKLQKLEAANAALRDQLRQVNASMRSAVLNNKKASSPVKNARSQNDKNNSLAYINVLKEKQLVSLKKKIEVYKKANAELKMQLTGIYNSETYSKLDSAVKEKQARIEQLIEENKTLQQMQRRHGKRIDELEGSKDSMPHRLQSLMEELRVCKEKLRQYKEKEKQAELRAAKVHEQTVFLTQKNQTLVEALKRYENSTAITQERGLAEEKLTKQKEETSKLRVKIQSLEKTRKLERTKYEKIIKDSQENVDACRKEMERYHNKFLEKEKEIRQQVLEVKKLKRNLKDLVAGSEENRQIYQYFVSTSGRFQGQFDTNLKDLRIFKDNDPMAASTTKKHMPCPPSSKGTGSYLYRGRGKDRNVHNNGSNASPRKPPSKNNVEAEAFSMSPEKPASPIQVIDDETEQAASETTTANNQSDTRDNASDTEVNDALDVDEEGECGEDDDSYGQEEFEG